MTSPLTSWPSTPVPSAIKTLISDFYTIGAQKGDEATAAYINLFTPTAQIVQNNKTYTGRDSILEAQSGKLDHVKSRQREIRKVYSCTEAGDDLLLVGNTRVVLDTAEVLDVGFCVQLAFQETAEGWKITHCQSWSDSVELTVEMMKIVMKEKLRGGGEKGKGREKRQGSGLFAGCFGRK
ncbi:uncharacterized protein BDZ99DRAFT_477441 [Mytilinidion resinicola]|uniref:SnoaL-like domain-containing protein n=1 Tax=Mytilinidion resinicola TaxID=574789 RepID=A0A6A6YK77_9PEZI|nr:uncharacterized protein BDZ99DRAFT_477441 [Mytilinidion resinicola]KAF2808949.1 hypothetical protein BDZ99DRAFT_477441 [Mytilinidion resinicola]